MLHLYKQFEFSNHIFKQLESHLDADASKPPVNIYFLGGKEDLGIGNDQLKGSGKDDLDKDWDQKKEESLQVLNSSQENRGLDLMDEILKGTNLKRDTKLETANSNAEAEELLGSSQELELSPLEHLEQNKSLYKSFGESLRSVEKAFQKTGEIDIQNTKELLKYKIQQQYERLNIGPNIKFSTGWVELKSGSEVHYFSAHIESGNVSVDHATSAPISIDLENYIQ